MLPGRVEIMKITNDEIGLREIAIEVKNPAKSVKIKVTKLPGKPASVVHEIAGKVYAYIEISRENLEDENIEKAEIKFRVEKSWLTSNNLDKNTVVLNRYEEGKGWSPLPTEIVDEDSNFVYYKATTPGFSYFAISAQEKEEVTAPPEEEVVPKEKEEVTEKPTEEKPVVEEVPEVPPAPPAKPIEPWMVAVAVLIGILLALLIGRKYFPSKTKSKL
jgi:PGF-pre-PGF domain-containing protein